MRGVASNPVPEPLEQDIQAGLPDVAHLVEHLVELLKALLPLLALLRLIGVDLLDLLLHRQEFGVDSVGEAVGVRHVCLS